MCQTNLFLSFFKFLINILLKNFLQNKNNTNIKKNDNKQEIKGIEEKKKKRKTDIKE